MMKWFSIMLLANFVTLETGAELLVGTPSGSPVAGRIAIGEYGLGGAYPILQARSFSTGTAGFWLENISFGSHLYADSGSGTLSISLYSNNGSVPGSAIAGSQDLITADGSTVGQSLLLPAPLLLQANSTYWFVISADQSAVGTRYWWEVTDSAAFNSDVPGAGLPLAFASSADGSWDRDDGLSPMMAINGMAVPEPGTISLFGIGAGGVLLARRKRMQRISGANRHEFEELVYSRSFLDEESGKETFVDPFV